MKAPVVYSSRRGNTRRPAEAVCERMICGKELRPVNEAPLPEDCDCIAVGFRLQGGQPDPKSASYLKRAAGVPLFLFATTGASADSGHPANAMNAAAAMAEGSTIAGTFHCQGEVDPGTARRLHARGHPVGGSRNEKGANTERRMP